MSFLCLLESLVLLNLGGEHEGIMTHIKALEPFDML
jgi:hypothetical protein